MKKIRPVLEGIYKNKELRKSIVPIFMGNPGLGKTFVVNEFAKFAKDNNANFIDFFDSKEIDPSVTEYIGSQISPLEVSGIGMPDKDLKKMVLYNFEKLTNLKDGDILFFDELPNSNPTTLNALLTLIADRKMMSGDLLPDIMIIAAGNYQEMTPMTPQIKERFVWYDIEFDPGMWKDFMYKKHGIPNVVSGKLVDLIKEEDFTTKLNNFHSARSIDKAVNMVIDDVITPYQDVVKPILETLITNKTKKITLSDTRTLEPNESISWLELIRINRNIIIPEEDKESNNIEQSINEIEIFDRDKNKIGELKDIELLKKMYYFSDEDIENICNGVSTPPQAPPLFSTPFFSKKKIIKWNY